MAPKIQQTKAAKAAAALAGGKKGKKKWNKGRVKDKAVHAVIWDQEKNDRLLKDIQNVKFISISFLVETLKIGGSLARRVLRELEKDGLIKPVLKSSKQLVYTNTQST